MSEQGTKYLLNEIKRVICYCVDEYDVTFVEAIGCLYVVLDTLARELQVTKENESDRESEPD